MTLPSWNGAAHVYTRLMAVAEGIQRAAYASQASAAGKARRKLKTFSPDAEGVLICEAMGRGDEEQLKAMLLHYREARS